MRYLISTNKGNYMIYNINKDIILNENYIKEVINIIHYVTKKYKDDIIKCNNRNISDEIRVNELIQSWANHMRRLGTKPVALYQVKIKTNKYNYLWEFNKKELTRCVI